MGLDISHGGFHGPYSAFNRLRQEICKVIGGSFPPHNQKGLCDDLWYTGKGFTGNKYRGLFEFLSHSDCDGVIKRKACRYVSKDLKKILHLFEDSGLGYGHIAGRGGYQKIIKDLIAACDQAYAQKQALKFY
jgi:hypothetical protein